MSRTTLALTVFLLTFPQVHAGPVAPTPAEQKIAQAEKRIETRPFDPDAHAELALALSFRAREIGDPAYYRRAEAAVKRSLDLDQGNYQARRARIWLLLGQHEFQQALGQAEQLRRVAPDDPLLRAFLVDAHVELGHYDAAERVAQELLDLRPGGVPGLTRAAHLRELFGDPAGALELMSAAYVRTGSADVENRAWILTQMGDLVLAIGNAERAAELHDEALLLFPGYHYALAGLARVRTAQGDHETAAKLYRERYQSTPHPECLYDLARALDRAGHRAEAAAAFAKFEPLALAESASWDNANRELIFYYLDIAGRPEDGLRLAEMEYARRRDIATLHAYGWALHRNGRDAEARDQLRAATAVGGDRNLQSALSGLTLVP